MEKFCSYSTVTMLYSATITMSLDSCSMVAFLGVKVLEEAWSFEELTVIRPRTLLDSHFSGK